MCVFVSVLSARVCVWDSAECLRKRAKQMRRNALAPMTHPHLSLSCRSLACSLRFALPLPTSTPIQTVNQRPSSAAPLSLSLCLPSRFHKVVFMHSHKHFYFNDFYYCAHSLLFMRPRGSELAPSALHLCLNLLLFVSISLSLSRVLIRGTQCQAGLSTAAFHSVVYLYVLLPSVNPEGT